MKTKIQIFLIFLIPLLINFSSCELNDKYVGTWKNINNGNIITISKHDINKHFTNDINQVIRYDIDYNGMHYFGAINGFGVSILYGFNDMESIIFKYDKSTGHLKGRMFGDSEVGEWEKQ